MLVKSLIWRVEPHFGKLCHTCQCVGKASTGACSADISTGPVLQAGTQFELVTRSICRKEPARPGACFAYFLRNEFLHFFCESSVCTFSANRVFAHFLRIEPTPVKPSTPSFLAGMDIHHELKSGQNRVRSVSSSFSCLP